MDGLLFLIQALVLVLKCHRYVNLFFLFFSSLFALFCFFMCLTDLIDKIPTNLIYSLQFLLKYHVYLIVSFDIIIIIPDQKMNGNVIIGVLK